jgi:hypothetical protein
MMFLSKSNLLVQIKRMHHKNQYKKHKQKKEKSQFKKNNKKKKQSQQLNKKKERNPTKINFSNLTSKLTMSDFYFANSFRI